jgi:cell wall-associated NlpC family hydrolase
MARVDVTFSGQSRGAVEAAHATATALKDVKKQAGDATVDLRSHTKALHETGDGLGKVTRGALAGSGVMGGFARSIAFASSTFLGAAGFVGVMKLSIGTASDLHEQLNKTQVVFKDNADQVVNWSKDSATAMGIARNEALAYAGTFGNLLVPMGLSRKASADMSTQLVQLASDLASFNNASPQEALEALRSGLTGEIEPMRRFGVFLSQNRIQAEALADGIVKPTVQTNQLREAQERYALVQDKVTKAVADHGPKSREAAAAQLELSKASDAVNKALAGHVPALTAAQKAMATYKIIQKDTKDAQGDFARTSNGLANQQRILKAQLTDLTGELGNALLPTITNFLPHLTDWIKKNEQNGTFQRDFNKAVKIAGDVIDGVIPVVKTIVGLFKTFADNVGGTKSALEIIGTAMVAPKVLGAVKTLRQAVKLLKADMLFLGSPAMLGAIAAGLAAFQAAKEIAETKATQKTMDETGGQRVFGDSFEGHKAGSKPFTSTQGIFKGVRVKVETINGETWVVPVSTPSSGGGGAGAEAGAKAAAGKAHGAPGATPVAGTAVSQIARAAAASAGAGSTSFHLENERTPYDCSAFAQAVFRKAGIAIGSNTYQQIAKGRKVDPSDLQADDLVFFNYGDETWPGHVAIYVGGGMVVHDHGASGGVSYTSYSSLASGSNHRPEGRCYIAAHVHAGDKKPAADPAASTKPATFHEKPKPPTRLDILETAVSRAKALTPKNTADDLRALRAERDYVKQRITEGHATKELYDQLASLNAEIDSITTGKKVGAVSGAALLSAPTRIAIAKADTPGERRSALVRARDELEKLRKTASKREKVPIAEELGQINKQIQAIDTARHKAKMDAIAKQTAETTRRVKAAIAAQKTAWEEHVRALQQIADDAKSKFEDKWASMADAMTSSFDDATQGGLDKLQSDFADTIKAFDKETSDTLKSMAKDAQRQLDDFDRETQRGLSALDAPDQTPEEQALAAFDAGRAGTDHAQRLQDLQQAVTDAITGGDPVQIRQAQKDLNNQLLDDQHDALQKRADESRKAADKAAQDAKDAYQKERDDLRTALGDQLQGLQDAYSDQRTATENGMTDIEQALETGYQKAREKIRGELDAWLDDQRTKLETGKEDWQTFFSELIPLANAYGVDAGGAFQSGWISVGPLAAAAAGGSAAAGAASRRRPCARRGRLRRLRRERQLGRRHDRHDRHVRRPASRPAASSERQADDDRPARHDR